MRLRRPNITARASRGLRLLIPVVEKHLTTEASWDWTATEREAVRSALHYAKRLADWNLQTW